MAETVIITKTISWKKNATFGQITRTSAIAFLKITSTSSAGQRINKEKGKIL